MTEQWKTAIKREFEAPEAKGKRTFIRKIRPREISLPEMLLQQVKYIRIITWAGPFFVILITASGLFWEIENIDRIVSAIAPFTVALLILEMKRSYTYHMSELEAATRFSLKSIVFARLVILGTVTMVVLVIVSPLLAMAAGERIILTAVKTILPYQLAMVICLHIERSTFGRKNAYASLAAAVFFSALILWMDQISILPKIYHTGIFETTGPVLILALMALTVFEQRKLLYDLEAIL